MEQSLVEKLIEEKRKFILMNSHTKLSEQDSTTQLDSDSSTSKTITASDKKTDNDKSQILWI